MSEFKPLFEIAPEKFVKPDYTVSLAKVQLMDQLCELGYLNVTVHGNTYHYFCKLYVSVLLLMTNTLFFF